MSKFYYIKPDKPFVPQKLLRNVTKWHGVKFQHPNNDEWLFWVENESTRGVEVSYDEPHIEVCVFTLSNHIDYQLVNWIGQAIEEEFGGVCENEDENINLKEITDLTSTKDLFLNDYKVIRALAKQADTFTMFGPHRPVHIGKNFIDRLEIYGEEAPEQLELWIRHIQYKLPPSSGNFMELKHPDGPKHIKLLHLVEFQVIQQYDYLAINTGTDETIIITNDDLNTILPDKWDLIDEYTIVAPPLDHKEAVDFISRAIPLNRIDEVDE